ncbi:hypothetical protein Vadar_017892 [Vaccinium darrowii]|uniref:Uncharacterized protein n=1 Tax=Vaccinium darrowii TaxID=229202 RepID=A0ACB7XAS1_9ERIC|nr:hypothetical protein Vadar_017892 [Vaccinium darrowii]
MDGTNLFHIFVSLLFLYNSPKHCLSRTSPNVTTDQSALLAFKTSITIPPDHILATNWTATTPPSVCDWVGITCSKLHRRVAAVDLPNMGLIGTIPPHLGNLSFLVRLNIGNNSLYGDLPKELANIRRLQYIDVSLNNFGGQIPEWFGAFSKLEFLNVQNNSFSGSIPQDFGNLQSLKVFSIQFNQFTGSAPRTIFNISSLEVLAFTGNSLSGNLPADLCNHLSNLKFLYLSDNEFEGQIPPGFQECSRLQLLALSRNRFTGRIPSEIGNLTMLKTLYISFNSLEGRNPSFLFNMSLEEIYLPVNNFSGSLPRNICPKPLLRQLLIWGNKLTGNIPSAIGNCTALTRIDLQENNFTEYGHEGLVSTSCDVYSFGILLMEVFCRKKPVDEMFTSDLSLKHWVSEALQNDVIQVIDSSLVRKEEEQFAAKVSCISSIFELALNCSAESPEKRINIRDALALLMKIRLKFLANLSEN